MKVLSNYSTNNYNTITILISKGPTDGEIITIKNGDDIQISQLIFESQSIETPS